MKQSTFLRLPEWQVVLGVVFASQFITAIGFSMVFPFLPLYVEQLGSTSGLSVEMMAGLVISVQGFTMMLASPLWGAVSDRYGRKLMVMRAMFCGAILLALMGVVRSGEELIFLRGVMGITTGTVAANNALVASAVPREKIGFCMGTLQVGLWAGVAAGPLIGGILADMYGFTVPFFITGILLFVGGVLVYFGVHENFERPKVKTDEHRPTMVEQWKHVVTAKGVSMVYMMRFLVDLARNLIIPIAPLFVVSLLPETASRNIFAGSVMAASSLTATFSGVYLGRLGDRIGHRTILLWTSIAVVLLYIPQVFVVNVWQLLSLQALAGFAIGGIIAAPSALLARYTEPGEEGAVYGLDNSIIAAARALAPIVGAVVAMYFGLRGTFAATAVLFVVVTLAALFFLPDDSPAPQQQFEPAPAGD
jgi:MFS transporter, DHA1 family, multidrug resistance protein